MAHLLPDLFYALAAGDMRPPGVNDCLAAFLPDGQGGSGAVPCRGRALSAHRRSRNTGVDLVAPLFARTRKPLQQFWTLSRGLSRSGRLGRQCFAVAWMPWRGWSLGERPPATSNAWFSSTSGRPSRVSAKGFMRRSVQGVGARAGMHVVHGQGACWTQGLTSGSAVWGSEMPAASKPTVGRYACGFEASQKIRFSARRRGSTRG